MQILSIDGVKISAIASHLGKREIANPSSSKDVIGFKTLRRAEERETSATLQVVAARNLNIDFSDFGALISVSFTQKSRMPNNSAQIAAELNFPKDAITLDLLAACSGYGYALYTAALLTKATGKKVLLLDGDKQSDFLDLSDESTAAVLADGATATILEPGEGGRPWRFHFETEGSKGDALKLEKDGHIRMDGFQVFRYVAGDVAAAIKNFFAETETSALTYDFFVPHQANLFMVRQLAKSIGFSEEKTVINSASVGNMASASIPFALTSQDFTGKRCLVSGFGGGLSLFVADITF